MDGEPRGEGLLRSYGLQQYAAHTRWGMREDASVPAKLKPILLKRFSKIGFSSEGLAAASHNHSWNKSEWVPVLEAVRIN